MFVVDGYPETDRLGRGKVFGHVCVEKNSKALTCSSLFDLRVLLTIVGSSPLRLSRRLPIMVESIAVAVGIIVVELEISESLLTS